MLEHPEERNNNQINVGKIERWVSAIGGGGLIVTGEISEAA